MTQDLTVARIRPQGMYPVVREDAAQMAALQMQAEHGPALAGDPDGFEDALGKVVTKQVRALRQGQPNPCSDSIPI